MLIAFIIGFGCLMLFCAGCFYVAGCDSDLVDEALNKQPYGDVPHIPGGVGHCNTTNETGA